MSILEVARKHDFDYEELKSERQEIYGGGDQFNFID